MSHETKKLRIHIGLRTLFALTVLAPVALIGASALWLGGRMVERAVQERLEEDVELVARAIQLPLSRALSEGHAEQLYEALGSAFQIRRVYAAAVYDASGEVVARVGPGPAEARTPEELDRVVAEGRIGEYGQEGARRVYSYFVPLMSPGGRIEGLLQVTRRESDIQAAVGRVRLQAAAVFGVVWVLMAVLVVALYERGVGRHFRRLSAAMAGVERGARDARVEESGPREVAEIAAAFNRMVAGVERAEAQVLERRAREATLEGRLRQSAKLAAIGRLAGGVAHELGTPLAVVDGMAQRLERRGEGAGEAGAIRQAVERMGEIVRQLLAFGSQASGERKRVAAASVLAGAAGAVVGEAQGRRVALEVDPAGTEAGIEVDRLRLEAALMHLLRNAVQAADGGGEVRARVRAEPAAVVFEVDDDGAGVPAEIRDRLFEPFFTTKPVGQGSGLGLAVVYAVAEEHGGSIAVEESELGGARFTLRVPREGADG